MIDYLKNIKNKIKKISTKSVVSLKPKGEVVGNVLLSYLMEPFLLKRNQPIPNSHTNYWESLQIAKTFLDLGYSVDVIDYKNSNFIPKKHYSFFIDIYKNIERIAPLINSDCVKIAHLTGADNLFQNHSEYKRLLDLQQRRGITLKPRRIVEPTKGLDLVDCATILGNKFTIDTYQHIDIPIFPIPISTTNLYPYPSEKDFEFCRNRFLWLGSAGMVHKGLDLVLEAFSDMPNHHLTVCGPVKNEKDFETGFSKELYQTPNIKTVGWIDVGSLEFVEITRNCIGTIYPSCSEGGGGSVINCLHAGLIPIISYQSSVDINNFGFLLESCSVSDIKKAIKHVSNLSLGQLKQKSRETWDFARSHHTREKFAEEYKKFVLNIKNQKQKI